MPSRNVVKQFAEGNYYHVYNRGVAKLPIFLDEKDMGKFISLLERHLDPANISTKQNGGLYRKFDKDLELLCYCLMENHFHLLVYLKNDDKAISTFIQSVLTAYTMYFNKKYKRVGTLFQGVFKASRISDDSFLLHITRYIHLNPRSYKTYKFSSLQQYLKEETLSWLNPKRALDLFESDSYLKFLEDHEDYKKTLDDLKYELAE